MSYVQGTQAATATPAQGLYNLLDAELTAHPAWDFVETTGLFNVWKCLGTHNALGTDFFVIIQVASATVLNFYAAEGYNAVTHKAIRPCARGSTTAGWVSAVDYSHGNGTEYNLGTGSDYVSDNWSGLVTGVGIPYLISVTNDRFIMSVLTAATPYGIYCGLYEAVNNFDPFPLCIVGTSNSTVISANASSSGGCSRMPNRVVQSNENFEIITFSELTTTLYSAPNDLDAFHAKSFASRVALSTTAGTATIGLWRGWLRDVVVTKEVISGPSVILDTITLDGVIHSRVAQLGGMITWVPN